MSKGRVLLAHGNADCRKIYGSVLAFSGYEVEVVADGESALRQLETLSFDIVVSDLYLSSDGDECLPRTVRTNPHTAHLPLVVITGWMTEPHRRLALDVGADAFLALPTRPRDLVGIVARLLEQPSVPLTSIDVVNDPRNHTVANGH